MIVTDLVQTCTACPSQWEGRCGDRLVYVRYRHGTLWVSVSDPGDTQIEDAVLGYLVHRETLEREDDGFIEWPEVERLIAGVDVETKVRQVSPARRWRR